MSVKFFWQDKSGSRKDQTPKVFQRTYLDGFRVPITRISGNAVCIGVTSQEIFLAELMFVVNQLKKDSTRT